MGNLSVALDEAYLTKNTYSLQLQEIEEDQVQTNLRVLQAEADFAEAETEGNETRMAELQQTLQSETDSLASLESNLSTISDLYEVADNQLLLAEESLSAANYEWEEIGRLIELNRDNFFQTEQPSSSDLFVARWHEGGSFDQFSIATGASSTDRTISHALDITENGRVIVGGSFGSEISWEELSRTGSNDEANGFVALLDEELSPEWISVISEADISSVESISVGPDDLIQVAGYFSGTAKLGNLLSSLSKE